MASMKTLRNNFVMACEMSSALRAGIDLRSIQVDHRIIQLMCTSRRGWSRTIWHTSFRWTCMFARMWSSPPCPWGVSEGPSSRHLEPLRAGTVVVDHRIWNLSDQQSWMSCHSFIVIVLGWERWSRWTRQTSCAMRVGRAEIHSFLRLEKNQFLLKINRKVD